MATASTLEPGSVEVVPFRDDGPFFEIIDGQRQELPPMSAYEGRIASRLSRKMGNYSEAHDLGESVTEVLFRLNLPVDRNRRPDAAFVSYQRWPKHRPQPRGDAWEVVPDLAVEIISKGELVDGLLEKIDEYFRAGVRLVWIVYPSLRIAHVYESWTSIRVLTANDELDGGSVLPGFRLPLASLFPEGPGAG